MVSSTGSSYTRSSSGITWCPLIPILPSRNATVPPSGRTLFGATVLGWGLFNLVEGIVNHQLLGIHHVWPAGPGSVLLWDVAFLVWGVLFVAGGYVIVRTDDAVSPSEAE